MAIVQVADWVVLTREHIMQFNEFKENDDGSCTCRVDLTSEETRQLLEYAIVELLRKHVQSEEHLRSPVTEDKP